MKKTLINNFTYIAFGLVVAGALSFVHADFALPTATPPGANIDVPLHTGPDQVKDGGLSVNTFLANDNAAFMQQTFLNGTVQGGSPTSNTPTSTVTIGDGANKANIAVNGNVSAVTSLSSQSVQNATSSALCATANGTIVLCGQSAPGTPPSFTQIATSTINGVTRQIFQVGSAISAGNKFSLTVYSHTVTITAAAGDDQEAIVEKLIAAVNATTPSQWRDTDPNGAPANGTPGFPPTAASQSNNPSYLDVSLDSVHSFSATATSN